MSYTNTNTNTTTNNINTICNTTAGNGNVNLNLNFNLNDYDQAKQDESPTAPIPTTATHTTLAGNISYKGWILTYQDVVNNTPGDISTSICDNLKWIPKFAIISKADKIILLYDYEPSNEILINNLDSVRMAANLGKQGEKQYAETSATSSSSKIDINYRLDNSVKKDMFVSYWRNRLHKFDLNLNDLKYDEANSDLNQFTIANHHLSNRDIEIIDKDILPPTRFIVTNYDSSLNPSSSIHSGLSTTTSNNSTTTNSSSSNGTFRFAGLFFKRDKSDKIKHSSLKRAKSGIQLERKKNQTPSPNVNNNNINVNSSGISNATNVNQLDYDNRHSLPSPMRPSRSHESLSSPLKQNLTVNYNIDLEPELCSVPAKNVLSSFETTRNQHPTTPFLAAKAPLSQKFIENIIRLDLNGDSHAQIESGCTTTPTSTFASRHISSVKESLKDAISLFSAASSRQVNTPYVNAIHNSLLNEENCFELKCPANSITIVNTFNKSSSSSEGVDSSEQEQEHEQELTDDDHLAGSSYRRASKARTSRRDTLPNLNKVKYYTSAAQQSVRYFMCRSSDERDKWIQCVRDVTRPNLVDERHEENSLQVWLLEAKGQNISSKPNKRYFCEIYINNSLYARTCAKEKKDILFWGENFEFNNVNCDMARVEFYQQTIETHKKKSKKDLNTSNQTFLGFINIPVSSIESSQPIEKWYKLESPSASINQMPNEQHQQTIMSLQQFESLSSSNASLTGTSNPVSSNPQHTVASLTTTQNFSKDSISIRIKAKYQCVDILPLNCYQRLIEFIRSKYLNLVVALEPHLNVRVKDDLANSLVKIAHKLQIQTKFLTDIVLAEVLQLEDNSLTFRGNSLATKAMESYMKLVGENYLKQTLSDCVRSIIDTNHDLEIDPSKVSNQSSLQSNREELVQILHLVCGRVFNSCINFPIEMKHVFSCLRTECKLNGKTDEMCDTLISASIFLRFICPAILSPNLFNLTQEYPQEKAARKLTLAAKTLQTIANFSKFGGKEFYMSFDKMNRFVDEHTILMREFLRNISTLTEEEKSDLNRQISQPILSLTPQTPNRMGSSPTVLINNEINFDLELIDLGKQLSILHNLLNSILNSLDEATQTKFDSELIEILNEITQMRKSELKSSIMTQIQQQQQQQHVQAINNPHKNKLYSYENRLHHAVMKNQQLQSNSNHHSSEFVTGTTVTTTPTTPSNATNNSDSNTQNNSSSSSSRYSSQITLNVHNNQTENTSSAISIEASNQEKLEEEIGLLRQKLKETEISLKKEQTEKYLIEYKLKQQQQENDQQMRSIINRLIKVEEELRKEQSEMHKLLKAKQDLIEIQKKRIEYLTNRSSNPTNGSQNGAKSTNQGTTNNHLAQNHPSHGYNQHPYQPKLKQNLNKNQHKPVGNGNSQVAQAQLTSSHSNPNMLTGTGNEQVSPSSSSSSNHQLPVAKLADKSQIAASPSSSSSSMTQFCSYLAANSLMNSNQNLNSSSQPQQLQSKKHQHDTVKIASPSSSTSSSTSSTLSSIHNNRTGHHHHATSANQSSSINFLRASEL